jgi:c-di-GMP-binding flagellar brake protein YcgR
MGFLRRSETNMFENTFSFWRRLLGTTAAPLPAAEAQDDRRLWVRHALDLSGSLRLDEKHASEKVLAKVRDLSLGGANLLVDRPVKPGEMVTLELAADDAEIRTVLACVVRSASQGEGQWSLGCVFARELSDEDLGRFGAKKLPAAENDDKRTWIRFSCELHAAYRRVGDPTNQSHPAQVLNISANGIGLSVAQPLIGGSLLNVDLLDQAGQLARTILACVVHTTHRAGGDYAVGCNFIRELSEEELQSLL